MPKEIKEFIEGFVKFQEDEQLERAKETEKDFRKMNDATLLWVRDCCDKILNERKSLSKTQANPEDLSANKNFTAQSVSPKPCPQCEGHGRIYVYPDDNADATICYKCEGTGKAS